MNNEPVAWTEEEIKKACRHVGLTEHMILRIKAYLPVHTHPAKTLTMAEMEDFINAYGMDMGDTYEFTFAQLTKMIVEIEANIRGEK